MIDWVRSLLMIFYAPVRGMREMRDRSLAPVAFIALASQVAYGLITKRFAGAGVGVVAELSHGVKIIAVVAMVLVPLLTLVANMFERRGSFRVVITQEYAPLAATIFYALTAANIFAILIATIFHYSGFQANYVAYMILHADESRAALPASLQTPEFAELFKNPVFLAYSVVAFFHRVFLAIGVVFAVRETFRMSTARAFGVSAVACFAALFVAPIALALFSGVLGSPFLLILLFLLLRGFFSDIIGGHRAKAAFKQNLESATLNPADASAHYNLGLIHQSRGELDQAQARFERALQIDAEEIDASYQLGRIALQQKRYPEAIQNFEHVVMRNPAHSQYEVWREVAATYIAAGQFEDARTALDQFLEHRPSDPEGLYLMGRAHAGLGHKREATSLMQACIEAVKTAPAYKYRASKHWLNEAQQFIKSSQ
jgi:tetratricopeptide (TPR) repeat protein